MNRRGGGRPGRARIGSTVGYGSSRPPVGERLVPGSVTAGLRPVVVGVDDVLGCHAALSFAVEEATVTGAQVRAVHVLAGPGTGARAGQEAALAGTIGRVRCAEPCNHADVVPLVREGPVLQTLVAG